MKGVGRAEQQVWEKNIAYKEIEGDVVEGSNLYLVAFIPHRKCYFG